MVIKLDKVLGLEDGEHHFSFESQAKLLGLTVADFEGRPVFEKPIETAVTLTKTSHVYYVKIKTTTEARFPCDRCLAEVKHAVVGNYEMVFTDLKSRVADKGETDELRLIDVQHNEIVLDKDVTDTIMLNLPTKVLCREDCKGLCVECGANLNEEDCAHDRELRVEKT